MAHCSPLTPPTGSRTQQVGCYYGNAYVGLPHWSPPTKFFIIKKNKKIVTCSNLNSSLKLLFCQSVIASNSLSLKICCENIVDISFFYFLVCVWDGLNFSVYLHFQHIFATIHRSYYTF